jgi:hypothetical protein
MPSFEHTAHPTFTYHAQNLISVPEDSPEEWVIIVFGRSLQLGCIARAHAEIRRVTLTAAGALFALQSRG